MNISYNHNYTHLEISTHSVLKKLCFELYNLPSELVDLIISMGIAPSLPNTIQSLTKNQIVTDHFFMNKLDQMLQSKDEVVSFINVISNLYSLTDTYITAILIKIAQTYDSMMNTKHKIDTTGDCKHKYNSLSIPGFDFISETTIVYNISTQVKSQLHSTLRSI